MRLAGSTPGELAHICPCFNISEDAYRVLQPFVNEGLDRAEKAVRTIDPRRRAEHLRQPTWAEILVAALHKIHQFELRDWSETHLRDGQLEHLKSCTGCTGTAQFVVSPTWKHSGESH